MLATYGGEKLKISLIHPHMWGSKSRQPILGQTLDSYRIDYSSHLINNTINPLIMPSRKHFVALCVALLISIYLEGVIDMPTAFKSIGKFKSFSIRLIAIISAGITLVVVVLLVGLVMNLVWGGIPPTDDSRLPSHMQNRPYMWLSEIDPFLRAVLLVVTAGPTFAVYNLVQRKLTKQAVAKIGPLEYPEEVKVFIRNTERAWSSFEGDAPSGMVGRTALQMMLGNMSSGTLIGSKALRILFESSNLYPNEFFIASDEAQSIYVLTNRRILNLYLFGEPPKQVNLDQMVSYDYVKKNFGGRAIMIKTRTGDFETEVNGDQLKFALKMKNWIDQNNRIDELR